MAETGEAPREQAWQVMRRLRRFTQPQVRAACAISRANLTDYVHALACGGYIRRIGEGRPHRFEVCEGAWPRSPLWRGARPGHACRPRGPGHRTQTSEARSRAWQAMRILQEFGASEIEAVADIRLLNLRDYLRPLERIGYLRRLPRRIRGGPGSQMRYRLVHNTGPLAPVPWEGGTVYDPNLRQVVDAEASAQDANGAKGPAQESGTDLDGRGS